MDHRTRLLPFAALCAALCLHAPVPAPAEGPVAVSAKEFFRGRLLSLEGRRITLQYDFSDPAQAGDWMPTYPFLRPSTSGGWRVEAGALRGDGNAGWRHRAVFDGELKLEATLSSEDARNFGAMVLDEDRPVFDLFSLADTQFAMLDRKPPLMHMVTTFLPPGQGPGGSTEWRYVETGYEPRIGAKPLDITVRKKGAANEFRFAGTGRLAGNDKEVRVGPRLVPGFYTLGSRVVVAKAVVSGVLDAKWLREAGIAFEDRVPPDGDPPIAGKDTELPPPPDAGAGAAPGAPPAWNDLLRRVGDGSLPKEEREKAGDELGASKERRALRPLIDILYRDEDAVGRDAAYRAFRGITGKEFGYRADAPKDSRLKAMVRIWDAWYAAKDQMEKEERKKEK